MAKIGPSIQAEVVAAGLDWRHIKIGVDGIVVVIDGDGKPDPDALSEGDRAKLDAVLAAHDPTKPAPPPSCTRLGLKRAFAEKGRWQQVKAMIDADEEMKEEWELSVDITRTDPLVQAAIAGLAQAGVPMTEDEITMLMVRANDLVGVPRIGAGFGPAGTPTA